MIIIGIMGRAQHGKDAVAGILQAQLERLGVGTTIYHAREAHPADRWVQAVLRRIDADGPNVAIISDIRRPNEAEAVRCRGGLLWKVVRPFFVVPDAASDELESFVDTMDADTVIPNMGGLQDLGATVARHVPRLAQQAGRRPARGRGDRTPPIHHMVTEWITRGPESYRYAMPLPAALLVGSLHIEAVIRVNPIGWTVWDLERTQIVTMGREQGDEARCLADKAAGLLGWILPDAGGVP